MATASRSCGKRWHGANCAATRAYWSDARMHLLKFEDNSRRHTGRAIAMQAAAQPDAMFLMTEDTRYTFGEANARVNALCGGLRALGLARGERVAFYMDSA